MEESYNPGMESAEPTATAAPEDQAVEAQAPAETESSSSPQDLQSQPTAKPTSPPFQGGKEKFKINDREFEWDWETTKRYAQKGYAGMQALQKAAETEKKAREFFGRLTETAKQDPETLIRTLLGDPSWRFHPSNPQGQADTQPGQEIDPREAKIRELESRIERLSQADEERLIAREREAFQSEMNQAVKAYPVLEDEIHQEYVKVQYRRALQQGLDVTVDDVAFHVAQKIEEQKASREKALKQKNLANKQKAPVSTQPGPKASGSKDMSMDDVKRLAGRI